MTSVHETLFCSMWITCAGSLGTDWVSIMEVCSEGKRKHHVATKADCRFVIVDCRMMIREEGI